MNETYKLVKRVKMFTLMAEFEKFVNSSDIEVRQIDIKVVEQSDIFQESFAAVVFYELWEEQ